MLEDHSFPLLSVIIPARNEKHNIVRVLEALRQCRSAGLVEVIVVDNGSTDGTLETAVAAAGTLRLRTASYPDLRVGALRNRGAAMASAETLAFLDADCAVAEDWIEMALLECAASGGIVGAPYETAPDAGWVATVWNRHERRRTGGPTPFVPGGNLVVSKADFASAGGFDETLASNEDFEFCRRAGANGVPCFQRGLRNVHFGAPTTLAGFWRQQRWHGRAVLNVLLRNVGQGWNLFPAAYAALMVLAVLWLLLSIPALFWDHWLPLAFSAAALIGGPAALSLVSVYQRGRRRDSFGLAILFFVYGVARASVLVDFPFLMQRLRHPVARNAAALYAQQAAAYVLPIVTIPYLARVLRPEAWGMVVLAQGFAMWMARLLEYGFNLSATRQIARTRDNRKEVGRIVAGVLGAQMLLAAAAGLCAVAVAYTVPMFKTVPLYVLFAWIAAVGQGLNPLWFFQGFEDMRLPAMLSVAGRVVGTLGVFVFVHKPDDGWLVLLLQVIAGSISVMIAIGAIYRRVPFVFPSPRNAWRTLVEGWRVFLLRGSITLYSTANTFLLGLFAPASAVAFYGGSERITRACYDSLSPISQALFPHMAHLVSTDRRRAAQVARVSFWVLGGAGLAATTGIILFGPLVVRVLLGHEYSAAVPVLRILALVPLLASISNLLGVQWMVPLGLERPMARIIALAALVNVLMVAVLAPHYGAVGMASAVVSAEATVTVGMYWKLRRLKLDPLAAPREEKAASVRSAAAGR